MKIRLQHPRDQGIALIIVMISIFVLAVLASGFAYSMKVETKLAMNARYETQLEWAGRSGIELARYVLSQELTQPGPAQRYDALDQKWAGGNAETNELLASIPTTDIELGPGITIKKWTITDTERKFNINLAANPNNAPVLQKALIVVGADASEIPTIISSIQDWIDPDNDTRVNGAETDYYQSLDPPYSAKNGPIDDLSELLLIKGVSPDIYWGPNSTNHPASVFQSRQQVTREGITSAGVPPPVGMVDIFTPVSSGLINILTASVSQLTVLPNVDDTIAGQIVQLRSEVDMNGNLAYNSPGDLLVNTTLGRQMAPLVAPYCTFRSTTFEAAVVVQVGQVTRTYFALLRRLSPRDVLILNFHWEDGDRSAIVTKEE